MKKLIIAIAALLFTLLAAIQAQAQGLAINDITVEVDQVVDDGVSANGGSFDAGQNVEVEIEVEVGNDWPSNVSNHEIGDITIEIESERFCDAGLAEPIQWDDSIRDLEPADDETVLLEFSIPPCMNEGSYEIDIVIEGEDDDGTDYRVSQEITMILDREGHDLHFLPVTLNPATVSCDRNVAAQVEVHNIGAIKESTGILIKNEQLNFEKYVPLELETEPDYYDDGNYFQGNVTFSLSNNVEPSVYPFRFEIEIGPTNREFLQYADLEVKECTESEQAQSQQVEQQPVQEPEGETVTQAPEQQQPSQEQQTTATVSVTQTPEQSTQSETPTAVQEQQAQPEQTISTEQLKEAIEQQKEQRTLYIVLGSVFTVLLLIALGILMYFALKK